MEFTKDELATLLDGLAALPLARSYNLFNKLLAEHNRPEVVQTAPQQELPLGEKHG
jgi:hypothetical protein